MLKKMPAVVFRVDASNEIGSGHVMRCIALAETLQQSNYDCSFICREQDGDLTECIKSFGFPVYKLQRNEEPFNADPNSLFHASWLGCEWQQDANQSRKYLEQLKPDWLIIDHYAIDNHWEEELKDDYKNLVVIDDLADRKHSCDILIDQNLVEGMANRYEGLVAESCTQLLGPTYSILQQSFMHLHNRCPLREGDIKRILVYFGGASTDLTTEKTLEALVALGRKDLHINVVVGSNQDRFISITNTFKDHNNIHVLDRVSSLAPIMMKADLAIGAAGITSWERLCLGLPSLVISVAANQIPIAKSLAENDLVKYIGLSDDVSVEDIAEVLREVLDKKLDISWSKKCMQVVDGKGTGRICAVIDMDENVKCFAKRAELRDESLVLAWVADLFTNEDTTEQYKFDLEKQKSWFGEQLRDVNNSCIYVMETEIGVPIGCVLAKKINNRWELKCHIDENLFIEEVQDNLLRTALRQLKQDHFGVVRFACVNPYSCNPGESSQTKTNLSIGICSDANTWINDWIPELIIHCCKQKHEISWSFTPDALPSSDICFYLGCQEIVPDDILNKHKNNIVVHESNLPEGRGWSPLTWEVLNGAKTITVSLIEAAKEVDSGEIYCQAKVNLVGNELITELREAQARATLDLCLLFMNEYPEIINRSMEQEGEGTYYARRFPKDSEIDVNQTIASQFNLLRVVDNELYPAWFTIGDDSYELKILKRT